MTKPARFDIERRSNLSYEEFAREYLYPLKPVIVTDVMQQWRALERWGPEFFKQQFGQVTFSYYGADYNEDLYEKKTGKEFTLAELIDQVMESTPDRPAPYLRNKILSDIFPSLIPDIQPLPQYLFPNWLAESYLVKHLQRNLNRGAAIELFIGGAGSTFPILHYDGYGTHAFLMQLYGQKEYIVYPPEQEQFLYPMPERMNLSRVCVNRPDLENFPLFQDAVPTTFVLKPGEMLFVPSHWWHTVRIVTPSITLAANVLNQSNWHELMQFMTHKLHNPVAILALQTYLTCAGKWRAWRDRQWNQRVFHRAA